MFELYYNMGEKRSLEAVANNCGKKTFAEVPAVLKDKVKEILIDLELPELAE